MSEVSKTAKPVLRGLLQTQIKKNLIVAVGMCIAAGVGLKFLYNEPKKAVYAQFYKTYDINKEFERMRSRGVFDSC